MDEAARQGFIQSATRSNLIANDLVLAGPAGTPAAGSRCAIRITTRLDVRRNRVRGRLASGRWLSPTSRSRKVLRRP
jgi:hypothetical protein